MQNDGQRVLSALVQRGAVRREDAIACLREAEETGESALAVAVRRGLVARDVAAGALAATLPDVAGDAVDSRPPAVTPSPASAAGPALAPGAPGETRSFGRYDLMGQLGEGGMGVVHEAIDTELGRRVALKVLHADRLGKGSMLARFDREARATSRLSHPNVCPVLDVGEVNGVPYYAMELIPGSSLAQLMGPGQPWRRAVEVLRDAALGLHHAHENGIVHRDVKPSNILVDEEGRGRVVDFGLAIDTESEVELESLTRTGQYLGTPFYIAPECIQKGSKTATPAADIYALGVTLYEALSGALPFEAQGMHELFEKVLRSKPRPPRLPPGAPDALAAVALRAIAREPHRRHPTALALANDLDRVLRGEAVAGSTSGAVATAPPAELGRDAKALLAAAGLLVLLTVTVSVWSLTRSAPVKGAAPAPPPGRAAVAKTRGPSASIPPLPPGIEPTVEAARIVDEARRTLWTGDLATAREHYRHALALDPSNPDAILEDVLAAALLHDEAAGGTPAVTDAVHRRKSSPLALTVVACGLVPDLKADAARADDPDVGGGPVAPLLRAARAARLIELSDRNLGDGDLLDRADRLLRGALEGRPRWGVATALLAQVLVREDKDDEALAALGEEGDIAGAALAMRGLAKGFTLLDQGKDSDADAVLKTVTEPPFDALARGDRASAHAHGGDAAATVAAFEGHDPARIEDWTTLARALLTLGKNTEARRALDTAVEIAMEGGEALALFRATNRTKEDEARLLLVRCVPEELDPDAAAARGLRARVAARSGDVERAFADLAVLTNARAIDELEHDGVDLAALRRYREAQAVATSGTIALVRGDPTTARIRFMDALAADPDAVPSDIRFDYARLLANAGDNAGAIAELASAAATQPLLGALAREKIAELEKR